ncbi:MAG: hydroxymethylglutaryl-CoA synthase [Chloroflexota bacterium]|nr:hydroxymethylglutaryl-CoA synthase [Chloroflexota bacterium]
MKSIGIEKINLYGCSLYLDQFKLAEARGKELGSGTTAYLIQQRSLNPPYEDAITMGANAAIGLLSEEDKCNIGMLIVGTESSPDFGKPMSTNIHKALDLPQNVRNYETKHACYSGVAALDTAINWLASGLNHGKKALVISTDFSREHLGNKEEFIMGGVATALLLSDEPRILEYELDKRGTWTVDIYDTFRPSAREERGNSDLSLYSYLDALEGAYVDYVSKSDRNTDFRSHFNAITYHTPFPGMTFQAHRTLCNTNGLKNKSDVKESFAKMVVPSLHYVSRVGSTYGSSNFVGLCSLIKCLDTLQAGDRIGFFSYGSGSIGEFYSGLICPEAKENLSHLHIDEELDRRREVTVEEYEAIERTRDGYVENPNFTPDFSLPHHWYEEHYKGKGYLVLKQVKDFRRIYERS